MPRLLVLLQCLFIEKVSLYHSELSTRNLGERGKTQQERPG